MGVCFPVGPSPQPMHQAHTTAQHGRMAGTGTEARAGHPRQGWSQKHIALATNENQLCFAVCGTFPEPAQVAGA